VGFGSIGGHHEQGRSPLDSETLERLGLLFDVNLGGDEVRADPVYDPLIRIDLGFQPSATASLGGGAEIEKGCFLLCFRSLQGLVWVLEPAYGECGHGGIPPLKEPRAGRNRTRPGRGSPMIERPPLGLTP
jgi:hypothetical protein